MPDLTLLDDEILAPMALNSPEAFAALYQRWLTPVYRYFYRRLGSPADAEDLCARTFTDALEALQRGRYQGSIIFAAWLFTIARRRLADFYRRRALLARAPLPAAQDTASGGNPEDAARLAQLFTQLDAEKQELLRLRYAGGLSFAAIAALEGRNEPAVKMTIYRTLDWMRDHWEDENV